MRRRVAPRLASQLRFMSSERLKSFAAELSGEDLRKLMEMKKKEQIAVPALTGSQWRKLFIRTAVPFFAFGVCDNIIMITVGDLIDEQFGVVMGFSTIIAAGLGQAVSDGSGVTIQQSAEKLVEKREFSDPQLTFEQEHDARVNMFSQVFRTIGIVIGCLFALIPVALFDTGNKPRLYDMLLKAIPEERRRELSARATYVGRKADDHLATFGEPVDACYTIVSGEVRVVGRSESGEPVELCVHGPGNGIGILDLVFGHDAVADVVCLSDVKLLRISKSDFLQLTSGYDVKTCVKNFIREDPSFVPYCLRYLKD